MSRSIIFVVMYHRHKLLELNQFLKGICTTHTRYNIDTRKRMNLTVNFLETFILIIF
jgi:hypothetical protein